MSGAGAALAGAFALALASPVQAMDLNDGAPVKDEAAAAPLAEWTGFHVSGQPAGSWPAPGFGFSQTGAPLLTQDEVLSSPVWRGAGLTGSIQADYSWGEGQIIYGVQGDVSFSERTDQFVSLRGRIGVVSDSWLFYGAAGPAFSAPGNSGVPANEEAPLKFDIGEGQAGYVAGAGIEAKLSPDVSFGVEGLHYGFGGGEHAETGPMALSGSENLSDVTVIRGRLTLRLDVEPGPLK